MERHLDRTRNILNLLIVLSCFMAYAGFLIKQNANILQLYHEAMNVLIINDPVDDEDADDLDVDIKLKVLIEGLSKVNDLYWVDQGSVQTEINKRVGQQGQNPGLSKWLNDELNDNDPSIDIGNLPPEYYKLFESDDRTLKIRIIEAKLKIKLKLVSSEIGDNATLEQAAAVLDPLIKLPTGDINIAASKLMLIFTFASFLLLLYISSLMLSIRNEVMHIKVRMGTDVVFFHPGRIGVIITLCWLFLPALIAIYWMLEIGMIRTPLQFVATTLSFITALSVMINVNKCRAMLFSQLNRISIDSKIA
jgi:hypothetical protein